MTSTNIKPFNGGRLLSIDALRGIAALGVVLYHAVQQTGGTRNYILKWPALGVQFLSSYGYVGVFLFFVISGFCIHLQWARANAAGNPIEVQFATFWKRRIRRLYPPYLIALVLYLLFAALNSGIHLTTFFGYDLVMHVLMLHNLDQKTCYSINGVFWTLAVEEQLYLGYFLLLFLRVRFGWAVTLLACLAARVGWYFFAQFVVSNTGYILPVAEAAASHWFTWALGAIGVEAFFGQFKLPRWCRNLWIGGALLLLGIGIGLVLPSLHNLAVHDTVWLFLHPVWGMGFFIVVNRAVFGELEWLKQRSIPAVVKIFASVGVFSYSLYLTHELVVMESWRFGSWKYFPLVNTLALVVPTTLAAAWVFFRYCERPYMRKPPARVAELVVSDTVPAIEQA
jgi:peptidoglycan/LPS O-acetylase OafA/YrhL